MEELTWGFVLRETGSIEESIEHFRKSVRMAPQYAEAHFHLGTALELLCRTDEARTHYRRALEINPNHRAADRLNRTAP